MFEVGGGAVAVVAPVLGGVPLGTAPASDPAPALPSGGGSVGLFPA